MYRNCVEEIVNVAGNSRGNSSTCVLGSSSCFFFLFCAHSAVESRTVASSKAIDRVMVWPCYHRAVTKPFRTGSAILD